MDLRKIKIRCLPFATFCRISLQFTLLDWNKKNSTVSCCMCFAWLTAAELAMNVVESFCIAEGFKVELL